MENFRLALIVARVDCAAAHQPKDCAGRARFGQFCPVWKQSKDACQAREKSLAGHGQSKDAYKRWDHAAILVERLRHFDPNSVAGVGTGPENGQQSQRGFDPTHAEQI